MGGFLTAQCFTAPSWHVEVIDDSEVHKWARPGAIAIDAPAPVSDHGRRRAQQTAVIALHPVSARLITKAA